MAARCYLSIALLIRYLEVSRKEEPPRRLSMPRVWCDWRMSLNPSEIKLQIIFGSSTSSSPAWRNALVARELSRYAVDIPVLSATRLYDEKHGGTFTFFRRDNKSDEWRKASAAFAVRTNLVFCFSKVTRGISDRLMTLRLYIAGNLPVKLIIAYAVILVSWEAEKSRFYVALLECFTSFVGLIK